MADLDTKQKRESGFGIALPFTRVGPTPDGSNADGEDERAHLAMNYNGIAAGAATVIIAALVKAVSNVVIVAGNAVRG